MNKTIDETVVNYVIIRRTTTRYVTKLATFKDMTTRTATETSRATTRVELVGADGLTDAERARIEADFMRPPSAAARAHHAAWRARKRAA